MSKEAINNASTFLGLWHECLYSGNDVNPRGAKTKEVENLSFSISPMYPFMTFNSRKYNISYFKKEMLWKLGADKFDESIKQHAAMWDSVQNDDGSFNSNYGQYWFGEQQGFWHIVKELAKDPNSRQAVVPMLNASHMTPETKDKVCTFGLGFRIRENKLNMSIQMRSSDQVFGLGTDLPTFSFLYRMVLGALRNTYPELQLGELHLVAMSSHIYDRHYGMIDKVLDEGLSGYVIHEMPMIHSLAEVLFLIGHKGKYTHAPKEYLLANWLIQE